MGAAETWSGRSVLVTGAGGFIGSNLVDLLVRAGANVRAFVRYNSRNDYGCLEYCEPDVIDSVDVFTGDLANPEAVTGAVGDREIVLHLGALIPIPYSYRHPREYVETNVAGTLNVLEAVRRSGVRRLVQVSSSEVYGTAQVAPIPETHPLVPQSPYAATKVAADQLALSFWRSFATPVVIARPFNTFGPRQSARGVIPTIITQALTQDVVELGSTSPTRDFLYVGDNARALALCGLADGIEGETINFGSGREISIGDLADMILERIGRNTRLSRSVERTRPPLSEVERLLADTTKARELLGWQPEVALEDGLQRTIDWMSSALSEYKPALYNV
jgi:NAD dependent epimerase/dehydratase